MSSLSPILFCALELTLIFLVFLDNTFTGCFAIQHHHHHHHHHHHVNNVLSSAADVQVMNNDMNSQNNKESDIITERQLIALAAQKRDSDEWELFVKENKITFAKIDHWEGKYLPKVKIDPKPENVDFEAHLVAVEKLKSNPGSGSGSGSGSAAGSISISTFADELKRKPFSLLQFKSKLMNSVASIVDLDSNSETLTSQSMDNKVSVSSSVEVEVEVGVEVGNTPPNAPIKNLYHTRAEARGGTLATDPDPVGLASAYFRDAQGRVLEAAFYVSKAKTWAGSVGPSDAYVDAMYNPLGYKAAPSVENRWAIKGEVRTRQPADYERGHIWGAELGGHDYEPLNFFPQHKKSNRDNSAWFRIERIAAAVRAGLNLLGPVATPAGGTLWGGLAGAPAPGSPWPAGACPVVAYIRFSYGVGMKMYLPDYGDYEIRVPVECYLELHKDVTSKKISAGKYLLPFINLTNKPTGTQKAFHATTAFTRPESAALYTAWYNKEDMCIENPMPVLAGTFLTKSIEYRVCEHLY